MLRKLIILFSILLCLTSCSTEYEPEGEIINTWLEPKDIKSEQLQALSLIYGDFCISFNEDGTARILDEDELLWTFDWCMKEDETFQLEFVEMRFDHLYGDKWDLNISHEELPGSGNGTVGLCESFDYLYQPYDRKPISQLNKKEIACD